MRFPFLAVRPTVRFFAAAAGVAAWLSVASALAQPPPEVVENKVYTYVEQMPQLPGGGGSPAIIAAIQQRVRYPAAALRNGVEGKVFVSFVVTASGLVTDPQIITDPQVIKGLGAGLDEAALAAVRRLPRFEPGKQNGRPVAVSLTVPVTFQLQLRELSGRGNAPAPPPAATARKPEPVDTSWVSHYAQPMPALPPALRTTLAAALQKRWTAEETSSRANDPEQFATVQAFVEQALVLPAEVLNGQNEGTVEVGLTVGASGVVRSVQVLRPVSAAADTAALQAVRRLPRLVPGRLQNQPVAVLQIIRLDFFGPNHVYAHAPQLPVFPAPGLPAYQRQHLRVPPVVAAENLDGQVNATFVVRADGRVADPKITTGMCSSCDAEVLRFLKALPRYQPAQLKGRPVAVRQTFSVRMPANPVDKDSLTKVYTYVEQMPTLDSNGGLFAIVAIIQKALVLPAEVLDGSVEGKAFVSFTVGPRGSVYGAKVIKAPSAACGAAALAAIKKLPRLEGGKQNGRGVAVSFTLPLVFARPGASPTTK